MSNDNSLNIHRRHYLNQYCFRSDIHLRPEQVRIVDLLLGNYTPNSNRMVTMMPRRSGKSFLCDLLITLFPSDVTVFVPLWREKPNGNGIFSYSNFNHHKIRLRPDFGKRYDIVIFDDFPYTTESAELAYNTRANKVLEIYSSGITTQNYGMGYWNNEDSFWAVNPTYYTVMLNPMHTTEKDWDD